VKKYEHRRLQCVFFNRCKYLDIYVQTIVGAILVQAQHFFRKIILKFSSLIFCSSFSITYQTVSLLANPVELALDVNEPLLLSLAGPLGEGIVALPLRHRVHCPVLLTTSCLSNHQPK
jgi:hypothetical protein